LFSQEQYQTVIHESLRKLGLAILVKLGVPDEDARVAIDNLVEADLRGVHSHGMRRLPWYAERLIRGVINPRPNIRVIEETAAIALVDGNSGLGQVVSHRAMNIAIKKAKVCGIGTVTVRNSHHFGTCAYWAEMALPHDMIGIAITNGGPVMAPWGGLTPTLSNDPIGVAIPAKQEPPIVLDMATSIVAGGVLDVAARKGQKIPLGLALDKDGNPTDDPVIAREGLLLPIAGYKGFGLTVIFEVLSAVLSGANFARMVPRHTDFSKPMNIGHYFQVIDVGKFMPVNQFKERIDDLIRQIKSSRLAPGTDRVYLPGEIEYERRAVYVKEGIPLSLTVVEDLYNLARQVGISDIRLTTPELPDKGVKAKNGDRT
jgi:LDH2 family malate/lactate/ureidoglycolate dehydrogenase